MLTTSLGLGSGDFLPGLDLHLNSMLGETDLLVGALEPGERMESMMAPTVALDQTGSCSRSAPPGHAPADGARRRWSPAILDEGLPPQEAVDRPRLHPAGATGQRRAGRRRGRLAPLEASGLRRPPLARAAPLLRRREPRLPHGAPPPTRARGRLVAVELPRRGRASGRARAPRRRRRSGPSAPPRSRTPARRAGAARARRRGAGRRDRPRSRAGTPRSRARLPP